MNKLFRKITAYVLLAAFMFILTPEYLVHEFTGHHDTVDVHSAGLAISPKHIHCESLQLQVQFFTQTDNVSLPAVSAQPLSFVIAPVKVYFSNSHYYTSLRGPPSV